MARFKNDDELFAASTMSFGEHLDELRAALIRSSLGLVVALAVAFPFADSAVRLVERPLSRSLDRYYRQQATDQLWAKTEGAPSVGDLELLLEKQLTPRRVHVDAAQLRKSLGGEQEDSRDRDAGTRLVANAINAPAATEWLRIVAEQVHFKMRAEPYATLWTLIPTAQQDRIQQAVHRPESLPASFSASQLVAEVLNPIIEQGDLPSHEAFSAAASNLGSDQRRLIVAMLDRLESKPDPALRQQINRRLLAAAFPNLEIGPRSNIVELTIWETGGSRIQTLGVPEAFMVWMKAWLVLALLLASPWIFHQIWNFVAAGLYGHERKFVYTFLPFSLGLFLLGVGLAFLFVFDPVLDFLFGFNRKLNINIAPRINDWIGFVLLLPLGFGISFQLPLVMLLLERMGIVQLRMFTSHWRIAILAIFVISMVLTPADPISMLLMAVPLTGLYFVGIYLCRSWASPQRVASSL